ncbi:hypothetical protein GPLA_4561 [Paraglaciecola polaris LMG 21857]|uniref:Uncharacterized protein n=1 Tax=Paraglaciecola polaris LMG 21857 TaxID=1129793 RepID=K7AJK7_9ALTE|nr:hypothetical protein GPLA_4561 [Paraglaciecola polaris LMG 21857]
MAYAMSIQRPVRFAHNNNTKIVGIIGYSYVDFVYILHSI